MATNSTIKFFEFAKSAGLKRDSLKRFLAAQYVPQPKQVLFHADCRRADDDDYAVDIGYGGARGGGKTHCAFAQIAIDDCQRFPNLKVLFLRKVGKYAKESLEDLRRNILRYVNYEYKNNLFLFPNGSRIVAGAYQYEKDIDNYLSLEYDIILIEQAEQLSQQKIKTISTVNRSSKGFRPRIYYTFNPGGIGHSFLKKKFIEPWRREMQTSTRFTFANYQDNFFLNKEYKDVLNNLSGWQKAAWRDGDWDIAAGQFFTNFRYDIHSKEPESIPKISKDIAQFWCALDYGWSHYTSCHLLMRYDGIIYVLAEYTARRTSVEDNAKGIIEMLTRFGLTVGDLSNFVAGSDVFAQRGAKNAETIADQYAEHGIYLTEANTDRINGAGKILKLLGDAERQIEPKIYISKNCVRLLETLPILEHDPNRPEDVKKIDADENGNGGDDAYDSARYGVMVSESKGVYIF